MLFRVLLLLVVAAGSAPAAASDAQGRFAPKGAGQVTCEQFLQALEARKENAILAVGWMEGFLTAMNQGLPNTFDIAPWQNSEALIGLVKHNCEQNKDQRFLAVVASLIDFLKDQRLEEASEMIVAESGEKKVAIYKAVMKNVQEKLIAKGMLEGGADGQFGPKTKTALEAFQTEQKIEVTGLPDQQTLWRLLGNPQSG
ncbi:MAG: peptidoglycan-binding protein [Rhodospirillales bacterium]|nr:peptidoglycan-binding protein [Rhodospirillales bacterium]